MPAESPSSTFSCPVLLASFLARPTWRATRTANQATSAAPNTPRFASSPAARLEARTLPQPAPNP